MMNIGKFNLLIIAAGYYHELFLYRVFCFVKLNKELFETSIIDTSEHLMFSIFVKYFKCFHY